MIDSMAGIVGSYFGSLAGSNCMNELAEATCKSRRMKMLTRAISRDIACHGGSYSCSQGSSWGNRTHPKCSDCESERRAGNLDRSPMRVGFYDVGKKELNPQELYRCAGDSTSEPRASLDVSEILSHSSRWDEEG
jgi:hypothetical protein